MQGWCICLPTFFLISTWLHWSFATINYLYADSLPSLIGARHVYQILSTVANGSHILISDRFSVIHHFKRFHQQKS
jgi:hypothetical protein